MDASERRKKILLLLTSEENPVTATALAKQMNVSRQIIVGDIALIRATGVDIAATPKGYLLEEFFSKNHYVRKIACQHTSEETKKELYTIVDNGGELIDVVVEHPIYGELSGRLNISDRQDADDFLDKIRKTNANLLSELTDGVHLHTISCKDEQCFLKIKEMLSQSNILYQNH